MIGASHRGPRPSGGVGGSRRGVKCLHAHYAWYLAGGDDPVGRWVVDQLAAGSGSADSSEALWPRSTAEPTRTRLLVYDGSAALERHMTITRLGQGVDATKRLAPEAIARTVGCLAGYREVAQQGSSRGRVPHVGH